MFRACRSRHLQLGEFKKLLLWRWGHLVPADVVSDGRGSGEEEEEEEQLSLVPGVQHYVTAAREKEDGRRPAREEVFWGCLVPL